MRWISPRPEPLAYTHWRAASQNDINYDYDLIPGDLKAEIKDALIAEQRGLCAYTGISIDAARSHIEHLLPQAHCQRGQEDVDYHNMVACFPGRNHGYVPFGAVEKGNWPSPAEICLFVSPRSPGCESRFRFNLRGKVSTAEDDEAARETIRRLGLDHKRLEELRRAAIDATLDGLDLRLARRRLSGLEQAEQAGGRLEPFCFALKQALHKHIRRLEAIRESKKHR
ncbi:MAG: retron system putative HNH endonuclease [Isosphaeraceae bacterium]